MQDLHSSSLFPDDAGRPAETRSKKGFAELIGVTPGRVSQLITAGLPVEPNGRINVARGKAWVAENVDPNRRRANLDMPDAAPSHQSSRALREQSEAEIARLKAEKMGRALIDRMATLRAVEGRARTERDAWLGWVNRAGPEIASESGGNLAIIIAVLDRLVRAQLVSLADMPLQGIPHE